MRWTPVLVLVALSAVAAGAHAELFRCTGRDGKPVFTDQKHTCPGADASEPTGVVHHAESRTAPTNEAGPAAAARDAGPEHADLAEQQAALWKQKKLEAEQRIQKIEARREWIRRYVSYCNRGAWITTRDDA